MTTCVSNPIHTFVMVDKAQHLDAVEIPGFVGEAADAGDSVLLTFRHTCRSHFHVGAAIELDNGEVVCGSNQENVAYPSGTCAERSACFYAAARYPESKFVKIVVAARGTDGEFVSEPVAPCGACRQALLEYEQLAGRPVPVILCGKDSFRMLPSVASTLPLAFTEF